VSDGDRAGPVEVIEQQAAPADRAWLRAYFESAAPDVLGTRTAAALRDLALAHRDRFRQRAAGADAVEIGPGDADGTMRLRTCMADRPFLVDTTLMVLREAGMVAGWMMHPVLRVQRDAEGVLLSTRDESDSATEADTVQESWMLVDFEGASSAANLDSLRERLEARYAQLRIAVDDYPSMRARLRAHADELAQVPAGGDAAEFSEAREFLNWIDANRFTFMASSESRTVQQDNGRTRFEPLPEQGLGLARPGCALADTDALIAPREELDRYADSLRVIVVTKSLQRAPIRHEEPLDVVSVKHFDPQGCVTGITRFVGLFAAAAYQEAPWAIPLIRRKCERVLGESRLDLHGYSGKALRDILGGYPRDELFQSSESELLATCMGIHELREHQNLRLFLRRDRYGRFFSALVYVPRERYSRELRDRIGNELLQAIGGQSLNRNVDFLRGGFARIQYQVRTPPGTQLKTSAAQIEQRLLRITRPFREQLRAALGELQVVDAAQLVDRFGDAFTPAYLERTPVTDVAADTTRLARLTEQAPVVAALVPGQATARLKLFAWQEPLALSDVLPVLQHFGIRTLRQDPEPAKSRSGEMAWIQDFEIEIPAGATRASADEAQRLLPQVLLGHAQNDALNRLVLAAALDASQIGILRMLAGYVNQVGLPYGRADIERIVSMSPHVACALVRLFERRFDPALATAKRADLENEASESLDKALDDVAGLDADRVLRVLASVVRAGLRTNFWQRDAHGHPKACLSLKLDASKVPELPHPRPLYEIWVSSPDVEGVHLRGGKVARGGLRWSDRSEDFRTEVLGLMKAQQVKNVVIVPVGAKGGFVARRAPPPSDREAWMSYGIECYRTFLRGLLDLTDNRVGDHIEPPKDTVRHDADDPYLVVAADKGTATFSDIANGVAAEYRFWLGDAFASGGSAGYDHKKMGITARGAWESVKRHFRELGTDIAREDFTVAGVGDMSGDVFGNGMLLSAHIRLVAAFDHRHVFLDPDPDAKRSFDERQRLFALPRSSWADYDTSLISNGGGVFPRTSKRVQVSPEAARALGIEPGTMPTNDLIRACLRAPVDLFWNGGIGTYVKASHQSQEDAHDRGNASVRVDGRDLRARVVGEGGNLGFTQAGRIEYALRGAGGQGGRINTDAIDNSGGVHCSDREVNIKIALNEALTGGTLSRPDRDRLLAEMTDEVAAFVLRDNEVQSGAISLIEAQAAMRLDDHIALIRRLEREGKLDRALEGLPDDELLQQRRSAGRGLTRPEIAVLVAYAKMSLNAAALDSALPDDAYFVHALLDNFPKALVERFRPAIEHHRLRREIVATILSNDVVNRMGASFAHRLAEDQGVPLGEVLGAYAAAHDIVGAGSYWLAIDEIDERLPATVTIRCAHQTADLVRHVAAWIVSARFAQPLDIGSLVSRYAPALTRLEKMLPEVLPRTYRDEYDRQLAALIGDAVPESLARRLTATKALGSAPDIADMAGHAKMSLEDAAATYFQLGERLRLPWLLPAIAHLKVTGPWQALARSKLREDAYRALRDLAREALNAGGIEVWSKARSGRLESALGRLTEMQTSGAHDHAALSVAVRELAALRQVDGGGLSP
jgi:glutamate dehydrogenase